MSAYLSEDEQVEAIKSWWRSNGTSVVTGIALGFALIFGWQGWNKYQAAQGDNASILYSNLQNQLASQQQDAAVESAKQLVGEYGGSPYATFASLELAKLYYQLDQKDSAREQLRWAMEHAPDPALAAVARLRLSQLLLDMQDYAAAASLVDAKDGNLAGAFAEVRGDLARLQGQPEQARTAYQQALDLGVANSELVRMKLVSVGGESDPS